MPSEAPASSVPEVTRAEAFVVIGGGLAGAGAALELRSQGFDGRVVLLADEAELPYDRPPLSKGVLTGAAEPESVVLHPAELYAGQEIELRTSTPVTEIDLAGRAVDFADGGRLGYDRLLLATGARARRLPVPGGELEGVLTLRRYADAQRLRDAFRAGGPVAIVGAGWIGLEAAAAARGYGCDVTVLDVLATPLERALGPEMGAVFRDLHAEHGVRFRLSTAVERVLANGDHAIGVLTSSGEQIEAATVLVGIGAECNVELAAAAGLEVTDGIVTDARLVTSDPSVSAAGDCARTWRPHLARHIRVEHWANALNAGPAAARAMLGQPDEFDDVPFFYTDQYDLGMECAGLVEPGGYDELITRGDVAGREFIAFWRRAGAVIAGMNVNVWDVSEDIQALIRSGRVIPAAVLADSDVPLAELAAG